LLLFGLLFIAATLLTGLLLAISVDALGARARPVARMVFLYPLSVSWLVTGLVWQWILNPGLGLERQITALGWTGFRMDALVREQTALYAVVGAGAWHFAGLVMALFLAGLGGIDPDIRKALRVEGIPMGPAYLHVILPMLRPYAGTALLLLAFASARTFDLVVAMTGGGPGFATDLPTLLIYDAMFPRSQAGVAAAAAVALMSTSVLVLAPYLALELRRDRG
jgi:glucose/mannose transport system permease protein